MFFLPAFTAGGGFSVSVYQDKAGAEQMRWVLSQAGEVQVLSYQRAGIGTYLLSLLAVLSAVILMLMDVRRRPRAIDRD